uniref:Uncharacterized protein n=1 Tax=Anopheles atroparvus TaxID=41427 RepID=A0AAG5DWD0_ANOAO
MRLCRGEMQAVSAGNGQMKRNTQNAKHRKQLTVPSASRASSRFHFSQTSRSASFDMTALQATPRIQCTAFCYRTGRVSRKPVDDEGQPYTKRNEKKKTPVT